MIQDPLSDDRNPVEVLAEEFISRRRLGEYPSVTEYAERYPDHAQAIREVFPTMMMMEQMKPPILSDSSVSSVPERIGDFRIIREVGRGGMGVVYKALQESLDRHVALKVLSHRALQSPKRLQRFHREAHAAAKLHHTNIVPVFGAGEFDDHHYLVMQFIAGLGLDKVLFALRSEVKLTGMGCGEWVDSHTLLDEVSEPDAQEAFKLARSLMSSVEPLGFQSETLSVAGGTAPTEADPGTENSVSPEPCETVFTESPSGLQTESSVPLSPAYWTNISALAYQVADALEYAHSHGTYHRDIKPANLLLDGTGIIWIADFGLAKLSSEDDLTNSGDIVGTLAYMSPEQFDGLADHRSDIYGLGLTLYELATLRPAYSDVDRGRLIRQVTENSPAPPRKLNPSIPRDLETIILKAIAKEPNHRYQTAREFAEDLQRFMEDRPVLARRTTPVERLWRWCRRNRAVASLSALTLSILVMGSLLASVGYWQVRDAYQKTSEALKGESHQRQTAELERERAEQTLDVALHVLGQVFDQVAPQRFSTSIETGMEVESELEPTELDPAVSEKNAEMLRSLLQFYDRFAAEDRAAPTVRLKSGQAYRRVGEIQARLGRHSDAVDAFKKSSVVLEALVQDFSEQLEYRRELVLALNGLGVSRRHERQFDDAVADHREALELLSYDGDGPLTIRSQTYLQAETLNELGMAMLMSFKRDGAKEAFEGAIARLDTLLSGDSSIADYRMAKARVLGNLASVEFFSREFEESRAHRQTSLEMMEALVRDFPDVAKYTYDLADRYLSMSFRLRDREITDKLRTQVNEALRLASELVNRYSDVPEYESLKSKTLIAHGRVMLKEGKNQEAIADFREAISLLKRLVYQFPSVTSYYFDLAIAGRSLGEALCEVGELADARLIQEESVESLLIVLKTERATGPATWMLSRQYQDLSETLALLGESSLAEESAKQADFFKSRLRRRSRSGEN